MISSKTEGVPSTNYIAIIPFPFFALLIVLRHFGVF